MQADDTLLHDRPGLLAQPQAAELMAEKVVVRFGGLAAISEVSLTVRRHEVFGLIGPNGAGKTTLVNCLTGFQAPTSGRILLGREQTAGGWPG
jgi:branched-chain amino acid transport system ATP-binding protein